MISFHNGLGTGRKSIHTDTQIGTFQAGLFDSTSHLTAKPLRMLAQSHFAQRPKMLLVHMGNDRVLHRGELYPHQQDRKSTRLNSSPYCASRLPSSAGKK